MRHLHPDEIVDRPESWEVSAAEVAFDSGRVISVRTDQVVSPAGDSFERDVVVHPGAVGILALDENSNVLLVSQYRHPVGHRLLEPPAGMLDVPQENGLDTARRELFEEAHMRATDWRVLVDAFTSPGTTDEAIRIFLARDLEMSAEARFEARHEEADMEVCWAPLQAVVAAILRGRARNPLLVMGALAAHAALETSGLDALRSAEAEEGESSH